MMSAMVKPCLVGAGLGAGLGAGGGCGVGALDTLDSSSRSLSRSLSSSRSRSRSRSWSSRSTRDGPGEPIRRLLYDVSMRGGGGGRAPGGFCARFPLLVIVLGFTCSRSRRICSCGRKLLAELGPAVDEEEDGPGCCCSWSSSGLSSSRKASSRASGGTSPTAWVSACLRKSQLRRNTLPQEVHSYGL